MASRVLILTASIGEGHDLPARFIAADVRALGGEAIVADALAAMGPLCERIVASGSAFESIWGARVFEAQYWLFTHVPPLRAFTGWGSVALGGRQLLRLVAAGKPDVVVSTPSRPRRETPPAAARPSRPSTPTSSSPPIRARARSSAGCARPGASTCPRRARSLTSPRCATGRTR